MSWTKEEDDVILDGLRSGKRTWEIIQALATTCNLRRYTVNKVNLRIRVLKGVLGVIG